MGKYSVTTTNDLRNLCTKNKWFTDGTMQQYEKLLYANENGCPISEIATIIWLCSNTDLAKNGACRRDILIELENERVRYWKRVFGIKDEHRLYRMYLDDGTICDARFDHLVKHLCDHACKEYTPDRICKITDLIGVMVWQSRPGKKE